MKVSQYTASNYLNTEDFQKPRLILITDIVEETVGKDDKLVLYFEGSDRGVPLGKTTLLQLKDVFNSDETDSWIGRKVVCFNDKDVQYAGKRVGGLRFRRSKNDADNVIPEGNSHIRNSEGGNDEEEIPF